MRKATSVSRFHGLRFSRHTGAYFEAHFRVETKMSRAPPDPVYVMRGHSAGVTALHFPCGDQMHHFKEVLISGSSCGEILVWSLQTFRIHNKWLAHNGKGILWLNSTQDKIVSHGRDGRVTFWTEENNSWTVFKEIAVGDIGFCNCSLLGVLLGYPVNTIGQVDVIETDSFSTVTSIAPKPDSKLGMCMCLQLVKGNRGICVFCGYESGRIILWSTENGEKVSELETTSDPIMCLDFARFGERCRGISGTSNKELKVWNLSDDDALAVVKTVPLPNAGTSTVLVRDDGKIVCTGGWDGRIRIFSWKSMKPLAVLMFHENTVHCLAYSNGKVGNHLKLLAAGGADCKISLWSIYND